MKALADWLVSCICRGGDEAFAVALGGPTPLCARCSGVYTGVLIGLIVALAFRRRKASLPPDWLLAFQVLSIAAMGVTGFAGLYGVLDLPPWAKYAIGIFFGQAIGCFGGEVVKSWSGRQAGAWTSPEVFAYTTAGVAAAGLPWLSWPTRLSAQLIALGSAAGVVAALSAANVVAAMGLSRAFRRKVRWAPTTIAVIVSLSAFELLALRAWRCWWLS